jgi:hypothetical protein
MAKTIAMGPKMKRGCCVSLDGTTTSRGSVSIYSGERSRLIPMEVRPNVGASPTAGHANEPRLKIWYCASSDLRAGLRFDGAIIAHPLTGRWFPA